MDIFTNASGKFWHVNILRLLMATIVLRNEVVGRGAP